MEAYDRDDEAMYLFLTCQDKDLLANKAPIVDKQLKNTNHAMNGVGKEDSQI